MLPIDFEITVQPYSLITVRNRALSPAARMLYSEIERSMRRDIHAGGQARHLLP
jgi:hypothetical protein